MRRASILSENGSVVSINRSLPAISLGSNSYNSLAIRSWHDSNPKDFILHGKFNSQSMSGLQIIAYINRSLCFIEKFFIYRIADGSWAETLVCVKSPIQNGNKFTADVLPADLGANELSGAETYAVRCIFMLGRKRVPKTVYFNHLGCFDNINLIRREIYYSESVKGDE